jgi:hypothetical protein
VDDMSERISTLVKDITALRTDVGAIRANIVTKEDLAAFKLSFLRWGFVGLATFAAIVVVAFKLIR